MLRVTSTQMHRALVNNIQTAQQRVMETSEQISSGYHINRPSDDPVGASQVLDLLSVQNRLAQSAKNISQARSWSLATENTLSQGAELIHRAKTLLLQASTDSSSASNRQSIAAEINSLADSIKMLANGKVGNDYIMSGAMTDTPAYSSTSDAYNGDQATLTRELSTGVVTNININAKTVFGDNTGGLLKSLRDAATHLTSGLPADLALVKTSDIVALDTSLDKITTALSQVGEVQNRIDFYENRIQDMANNNNELLSITRDTDIAQASANYAQRQSALTAALKTGQGIVQPSLIDFLK